MPLNNPPKGGAEITIAETEVFSGSSPSPSAWTDLDLSGIIGAKKALVILKATFADTKALAFKTKGDTDGLHSITMDENACGCALSKTEAGLHQVFLVTTDSAGIVQWIYEETSVAGTIDIIGYVK